MIRQGKYTKKVTPVTRAKRAVTRRWQWFKGLSKKKKALVIGAPILAFLILTPLITYLYYAHDISDQERLMNRNNTGIVLTDKSGGVIYSTGRAQHRALVPLTDIAKVTQNALIASEDKDFYKHSGFSVDGILRAVWGTVTSQQELGGGSTLTQQLAKTNLLTKDQTFMRKYQELAISIAIEQQYSKDQILDMYLNSSFFGGTSFGIEDAAKAYFNKAPKDLNLAESAMLVGVLPAPNAYSPIVGNPVYAKERQTTVLTRMVTNGFITEAEKTAALAEELAYAPPQEETQSNDAPHFAQMVLQQLYDKYGEEKVIRSGYQVTTTLDTDLQKKLQANVNEHMPYIQQDGGSNAGGVAIDPTSGEVRALVGSADWNNPDWGKVNMATTARQPGSSFKPIYYSQALADGIVTPATMFGDVPTDFGGYTPQNASRTFSGDISVRNALDRSLNIPSVKIMQKLGTDKAVETARRMGITAIDDKKDYGLSLALGAAEAPLMQMTNAYAAFANQGQQFDTSVIQKINDKYDSTIFKTNEKSKEVMSPEGAFLISDILADNKARSVIFGSSLTIPGHTVAVKTGTTDDDRDAWTIGYSPQLAVGVWVGNNNNETMLSGGSDMAGPIWAKTMKQALANVDDMPFAKPSSIVQKPVCYGTDKLANTSSNITFNEYFMASALPTGTCNAQPVEQKTEEKPKDPDTSEGTEKTEDTDTSSGSGDADTTTPEPGDGSTNPDDGTGDGDGTTTPGTGDDGTGDGTTTPPGTGGGTTPPVTP